MPCASWQFASAVALQAPIACISTVTGGSSHMENPPDDEQPVVAAQPIELYRKVRLASAIGRQG